MVVDSGRSAQPVLGLFLMDPLLQRIWLLQRIDEWLKTLERRVRCYRHAMRYYSYHKRRRALLAFWRGRHEWEKEDEGHEK